MSNFKVEGTLHVKGAPETKGNFTFRELILKVQDGAYEQFVKFQLSQDRCELLDPYQVGDTLNVHFNLRGKEYQGKYFTSLNAWKLERQSVPAESQGTATKVLEETPFEASVNSDLPF